MNCGAERPPSLPGQTFKVFLSGGLESAAECGAWAAGAALAAAPGAVAAAAAARAAALGWDCTAAEGAPAPPFHCPPGEPASFAPHLQRQKDPTVRHVGSRSRTAREMCLAQARKTQILALPGRPLSLSGVPTTPVNNKNHHHLCIPGKPKSFGCLPEVKVPGGVWGSSVLSGLEEPTLPGRPQRSPMDTPTLGCSVLFWKWATEGKLRCNPRKQRQSILPCHYPCWDFQAPGSLRSILPVLLSPHVKEVNS